MVWFACCVVFVVADAVRGFNLDPFFSMSFRDPQANKDSFFGYSVNLQTRVDHSRSSSWVIVGAPRANSSSHSDLTEPGVVYQCELETEGKCSVITLENTGNEIGKTPVGNVKYWDFKDNAWIGGSIDVEQGGQGRIVVCAPRWINQQHDDRYLMNGICYLKETPLGSTDNALKYMPLYSIRNQIYNTHILAENKTSRISFYAHGETGLSVHFPKDGNEMIIGAPGVKQWTGTVIRYNKLGANLTAGDILIPHPVKTTQLTEGSYFGYSVGSGKFLRSNKTFYVAGAPRGGHLTGQVLIFDFPDKDDASLEVLVELNGQQMGEYFGSALCVVDLNNDGLDDLVVGAPQYSLTDDGAVLGRGDEGRVYVFVNQGQKIFKEIGDENKIMGMEMKSARFGTAVVNIGDLNADGYADIAVGAPYEDSGNGAVYIYNGRSSGIHRTYSQRITPRDVHLSNYAKGFGISISRGLDIDGNLYNDIAVGAFISGHVVIIPSRPVVAVRMRLYSGVEKIGLNTTSFTVFACFSYSGVRAPLTAGSVIILGVMDPDGKVQFADSGNNVYEYTKILHYNQELCDEINITILEGGRKDFTKPIEIQMRYELDGQGPQRKKRNQLSNFNLFCKTCPVVDPNAQTSTTLKVAYATDCGAEETCRTDLQLKASVVDSKSMFVLGSDSKITMRVTVSNKGRQSAYLVKLNVSVSSLTPLYRLPAMCREIPGNSDDANWNQLECDLHNILPADEKTSLLLEVDASGLGADTKSPLVYKYNATSVSEEQTPDDNSQTISLPIQVSTDVTVDGKSSHVGGNYAKNNQTFYHRFEVRNYGPSPADILEMEFQIPVSLKNAENDVTFVRVFTPMAHFDSQPFSCSVTGGNFESNIDQETETSVDLDIASDSLVQRQVKRAVASGITKRSTENTMYQHLQSDLDQLPLNRTKFVNCSSTDVKCLNVLCNAGPFKTTNNRAVISFQLIANFQKIESILGKKDIVAISSSGRVRILNLPNAVQPLDGKPDVVMVTSMFFGSIPEVEVDSPLILGLAVAGGLLLLLLLIGGLAKVGFFSRQTKQDLEKLMKEDKAMLENEDEEDEEDIENGKRKYGKEDDFQSVNLNSDKE